MTKYYTVYEKMSEKEAQTMVKHNRSVSGIYTSDDDGHTLVPYAPPKIVDMSCIIGNLIPVKINFKSGFLLHMTRRGSDNTLLYGDTTNTYFPLSERCTFIDRPDAWVIPNRHPAYMWPEGVYIDILYRSGAVNKKFNPRSGVISWDCVVATKFNSLMEGWVYSHEA